METPLKDKGPEQIDFVVIRENSGGIYTGMGGVSMKGTHVTGLAFSLAKQWAAKVALKGEVSNLFRRPFFQKGRMSGINLGTNFNCFITPKIFSSYLTLPI